MAVRARLQREMDKREAEKNPPEPEVETPAKEEDKDRPATDLDKHIFVNASAHVFCLPACGQFMSKASRVPWNNSRCPYHLIKEKDQRLTKIFPKVRQVCLYFVPAPVGKSSSFHEEEKKPHYPVRKRSAEKQ